MASPWMRIPQFGLQNNAPTTDTEWSLRFLMHDRLGRRYTYLLAQKDRIGLNGAVKIVCVRLMGRLI